MEIGDGKLEREKENKKYLEIGLQRVNIYLKK